MTRSKLSWSSLRMRPKLLAGILVVLVAGVAAAAGAILSNVLEYPGVVNNQMIVYVAWLGSNGTSIEWYTGVEKNVSVMVDPNAYVGTAHVVYEVEATSITCSDVALLPKPYPGDSATCSEGTNIVVFDANSKYFNGSDSKIWWFHMVFYNGFASIVLRVYVAQG